MNQAEREEYFNELSARAARDERRGEIDQAQEWRDSRWLSFPSGPQKQMYFPGTTDGRWSKLKRSDVSRIARDCK